MENNAECKVCGIKFFISRMLYKASKPGIYFNPYWKRIKCECGSEEVKKIEGTEVPTVAPWSTKNETNRRK